MAASTPPFGDRIARSVPLARSPTALGGAFGSLWLTDDAGQLLRLDPASAEVLASVDLGVLGCGSIREAADSLWLSGCPDGDAVDSRITLIVDPDRTTVVSRLADGGGDGVGASAMRGLVWFVSDVAAGVLSGVDVNTRAKVAEVKVGFGARHVTAGFGSLWVAPIGRNEVLRIDPVDGRVIATVALSGDPSVLLTTADGIWVAEPHQWLLGRVDPATDRVVIELEAAPGVDQLVAAENGWIWSLGDDEALAVDPLVNRIADRFSVPPHAGPDGIARHVLAALDGDLWFADRTSLVEIGPVD
ncbi:MAG: hypothetical protein AB1736_00615 [Chloroflexota bacterium]